MIPLQTASRHPVSRIVFSPDGSMLAVAQPFYGVTVLDRATGGTLAVCAMPRRAKFTGLTFFAGGKYLAAGHLKGLEIFDAKTGVPMWGSVRRMHQILTLTARDGEDLVGENALEGCTFWKFEESTSGYDLVRHEQIRGCPMRAFSANGRFGIAPRTRGESFVDVVENRVVAVVKHGPEKHLHPRWLEVGLCSNGKRFALNNGLSLDVYDARDRVEEDAAAQQPNSSLAGGANGKAIAVAPKPHIVLAPTFSLQPADATEGGKWYPPFALLADGRGLLVKRPRNRIQWWDAPTGTLVNEWSWRFEWVTCVAVCADGLTAVAGGRFGRVLLWDLE